MKGNMELSHEERTWTYADKDQTDAPLMMKMRASVSQMFEEQNQPQEERKRKEQQQKGERRLSKEKLIIERCEAMCKEFDELQEKLRLGSIT